MREGVVGVKTDDGRFEASVVYDPQRPLNRWGEFTKSPWSNPGSGTWHETKRSAIVGAMAWFSDRVDEYYNSQCPDGTKEN